ncbi:MAG: cytochrome c [Polyangiales bacterium]
MGKNLIAVSMIGLLAFAFACSKESGGTTALSLASFEFPLESTDVATGSEVYAEFCEGCHPGGEAGDGPKIAGDMETPAELRWRVRSGGDDMPAFGPNKISNADLEALLAFTETFGAVKR